MTENPVIAEVTRGGIVESRHRGAYAVTDASGTIVLAAGDISTPVFPRSAIKAFQFVPVIASGAADHFALTDEEIALCCASHHGEERHVAVARSILSKCGCSETDYECGAHLPSDKSASHALVRSGEPAGQVHNNCSGKHAGMLAYAAHMKLDRRNYTDLDHPVQKSVAATLEQFCEIDIATAPVGIDGCSVPTWAVPLKNLAVGFARLPSDPAGQRIVNAVRAHPFMVAGSQGFDTHVMQAVPRLFVKYGAEAVYCGCIPHANLGFALKVDDGASRAAEVAIAGLMLKLGCWTREERSHLAGFANVTLRNWRKRDVGLNRATV